jgi:hypothetical protein
MALDETKLKSDLIALFTGMTTEPTDIETQAAAWAKLLVNHIQTAGVPAGSVIVAVVGDSTGTPNAVEINVA